MLPHFCTCMLVVLLNNLFFKTGKDLVKNFRNRISYISRSFGPQVTWLFYFSIDSEILGTIVTFASNLVNSDFYVKQIFELFFFKNSNKTVVWTKYFFENLLCVLWQIAFYFIKQENTLWSMVLENKNYVKPSKISKQITTMFFEHNFFHILLSKTKSINFRYSIKCTKDLLRQSIFPDSIIFVSSTSIILE